MYERRPRKKHTFVRVLCPFFSCRPRWASMPLGTSWELVEPVVAAAAPSEVSLVSAPTDECHSRSSSPPHAAAEDFITGRIRPLLSHALLDGTGSSRRVLQSPGATHRSSKCEVPTAIGQRYSEAAGWLLLSPYLPRSVFFGTGSDAPSLSKCSIMRERSRQTSLMTMNIHLLFSMLALIFLFLFLKSVFYVVLACNCAM